MNDAITARLGDAVLRFHGPLGKAVFAAEWEPKGWTLDPATEEAPPVKAKPRKDAETDGGIPQP